MGMIIIPVFLLAFVLGILATIKLIVHLRNKQINTTQVLLGLALLVLLWGIILMIFVIESEIYAFSPAFRIPLVMVFLMSLIYMIFSVMNTPSLKYVANIILVNIAFAGIFGLLLLSAMNNLLEVLGVNLYH